MWQLLGLAASLRPCPVRDAQVCREQVQGGATRERGRRSHQPPLTLSKAPTQYKAGQSWKRKRETVATVIEQLLKASARALVGSPH